MSGLKLLYNFILKEIVKKSGKASGILSIGGDVRKLADKKFQSYVMTAQKKGVDLDKLSEQEIKYILELNKPKGPMIGEHRVIDATSSEGQGITRDLFNMLDRQTGKNVIKTDFGSGITKTTKSIDLSKYDDAALNALAEEGNKIKVQLEKLGESGTNYGEFKKLSARKKEIDDILSAAQDVPPSGYDNFKADLSLNKQTSKVDIVTDTVTKITTMEPVAAMKEANLVIGRKGKYKNLTKEQSQKILKDTDDWIFQRDPDDLYDYNKKRPFRDDPDFDPEDFAHGGRASTGLNYLLGEDDQNSRVPYAAGSTQSDFNQYLKDREQRDREEQRRKFKKDFEDWKKWQDTQGGTMDWAAEGGRIGFGLGGMTRRAFLKWLGAGTATAGVAKSGLFSLLKGGASKSVIAPAAHAANQIVQIKGMPYWFKPLVNKVIKEGDDVTKKFASKDMEIVHKSVLPHSNTDVIVTQSLDTGDVMVDLGVTKHGFADGKFGQPVQLIYKAEEAIEPTISKAGKVTNKGQKTKPEFWVDEAEFTGGHPENIKFEETISSKFGKHESNFDEVEAFAKGKTKKTRKISPLQKQSEDLADHFSNYPEPDDFASGGRVPFIFGGGAIKNAFKRLKDVKKMKHGEKMLKKNPNIQHLLSTGDKQTLKALETQFSEQLLRMLKKDRELMLQIQSNKAMQDEGLDFLMKHMQESMAPHIKKYKSIEEIDEAILNMENIIKNKAVKEGRHLNASGGLAGMLGE